MESVVVYTGKDLRRMREEGGCGHWTASPIRVEAARYLVCVRNRREQWAAMDHEHGVAFLIAKISGTKPSMHAARITIEFGSYALLDIPDAWQLLAKGQRFPVAYMETADLLHRLKLNPDALAWKPFTAKLGPLQLQLAETPAPESAAPDPGRGNEGSAGSGGSFAHAVAQAKRRLADSLGIAAEKIEITIRL